MKDVEFLQKEEVKGKDLERNTIRTTPIRFEDERLPANKIDIWHWNVNHLKTIMRDDKLFNFIDQGRVILLYKPTFNHSETSHFVSE